MKVTTVLRDGGVRLKIKVPPLVSAGLASTPRAVLIINGNGLLRGHVAHAWSSVLLFIGQFVIG